jgi:hypothetical protein
VEKALKEINLRYELGLPLAKLMERIRLGNLSPDAIGLGLKSIRLKSSWKLVLAETMARLILEDDNFHMKPEMKEVLNAISSF